MEEETTWTCDIPTLLVFTGIVVLSSTFFILGILVGRTQGQKIAGAGPGGTPTKVEARASPKKDKQDFTFWKDDPLLLQPIPEPLKKAKRKPAPELPGQARATATNVVNYQVVAVHKSAEADKLLEELRKKGFPAFIVTPAEGAADGWYRVQVGPFHDLLEAQDAKKKLEREGYEPILKK
jgi:cell division protein FtsN